VSVMSRLRAAGFEVYLREQWGTRQADAYATRAASAYYQLPAGLPYHFLHLTVTRDGDTVREGKEGARQIETYGYTTPPMVSYQALVTNEGRIYEGQSYGVKGTHTVNDKNVSGFPRDLNRAGYAVALMQDVEDEVTDAQVVAVAACYAAAELEGFVARGAPVYPHNKFAWKACPGPLADARLQEIAHLKNQLVASGLPTGANQIGSPQEDDMALSDKLYPHRQDSPTVNDALRAILRLEAAEKRRNEALRKQIRAVRTAIEAQASPAEVQRLLEGMEATIQLVVTDTTEEKP
jgi:hypothetical protein